MNVIMVVMLLTPAPCTASVLDALLPQTQRRDKKKDLSKIQWILHKTVATHCSNNLSNKTASLPPLPYIFLPHLYIFVKKARV